MLQTIWIALGLLEYRQSIPIRYSFGKAAGMPVEGQKQFFADIAALPTESVVHP